MYICGLPFDEVVNLIKIYKETGHATKEYMEGFADGVKAAQDVYKNTIKEMMNGWQESTT